MRGALTRGYGVPEKNYPILRAYHSQKGGFTLIELVVVLFIISLFVGLVYPTISLNFGEAKRNIHKMASIIRYVRDSALYHKRSFKISFDFKKKTVFYETPEGTKKIHLKELVGVKTPSHGLVSQGQLIVLFNLLGEAEPMIILFDSGDCIEYNPYSQMVRELKCTQTNRTLQ